MYMCTYSCVTCVIMCCIHMYVVKEVASFQGLDQLMGVEDKRMRARALQTKTSIKNGSL